MDKLLLARLKQEAVTEGAKQLALRVVLAGIPNASIKDVQNIANELELDIDPDATVVTYLNSELNSYALDNASKLGFDDKTKAVLINTLRAPSIEMKTGVSLVQAIRADRTLTNNNKLNSLEFLRAIDGGLKEDISLMKAKVQARPVEGETSSYTMKDDVAEEIYIRNKDREATSFIRISNIISESLIRQLSPDHYPITVGIELLLNLHVAKQTNEYQNVMQPLLNGIPRLVTNQVYEYPRKSVHRDEYMKIVLAQEKKYIGYLSEAGLIPYEHAQGLRRLLVKIEFANQ